MSQKNSKPLASYFTNSGDFLVSNRNSSVVASATTTDLAGRTFFDLIAACTHTNSNAKSVQLYSACAVVCVYICIKNESNKFNFFQNKFCLSVYVSLFSLLIFVLYN